MAESQEWTTIIRPKRHLLDINLREILHYKDLIYLLIRRDFVARYKQTILGPLWYIVQPLLTTIMFTVVFGRIAKIPTDGVPHMLFYLSGTVIWGYFSKCLTSTSNTFIGNAGLFGKVYFPRLVIPISVIISNLFQFIVQFSLLSGFWIYFWLKGADIYLTWSVLLLPVYVAIAGLMGLGLGLFFSSLTTKYRDLVFLLNFGMQLWMYGTPIVYPLSQVPQKWKLLIVLNPMTPVVEGFRKALLGVGSVESWNILYSLGFMLVMLFVGVITFNKVEQNFMDTI